MCLGNLNRAYGQHAACAPCTLLSRWRCGPARRTVECACALCGALSLSYALGPCCQSCESLGAWVCPGRPAWRAPASAPSSPICTQGPRQLCLAAWLEPTLACSCLHASTWLQFEKDDDTNFHMDMIAGLANMRARNYSVAEVSGGCRV